MVSTTDDLVGGEAPPSHRGAEPKRRQPGRLRRALVTVAEATAVGALFVLTAAGSAVAHLGLPAPRRLVVEQLNANLAGMFKGRLLVDRIGHLRLWRGEVGDVRVRVLDPGGQQVLLADGVTARLDLGALLASLRSGGSLALTVHGAEVNLADVVLRDEPDGTLTLARAFESATPPEPPKPGSVGPTVRLMGFHLRHGWVHGGLAAYPVIDADALEAHGDFTLDDASTDVTMRDVGINARALPLPGTVREAALRLEGHLHLPTGGDLAADAVVHELQAGRVKATARGSIAGSRLDAAVDLPPTAPEALREVVPQAPLYAPVGARVTAKGTLPRLDVVVRSTVGEGTVDVDGALGLGDVLTVDATVVTRQVAPRSFAPEAPEGLVTATAKGSVRVGPGDPEGTYSVTAEPTVIAGQPTPAVQTEGRFVGASVKGILHAQEPGLTARVNYDLKAPPPGSETMTLGLDVEANSDQLGSNARLGGAVSGRAHVTGHGTVSLGPRTTVVGEASVQASGLRAGTARVGSATVRARVQGDVSNPQVNVQATASRVVAGDYPVDRVVVRADGTPAALRVEVNGETPNGSIGAQARVALGRGVAVQGTVQGEVGRVDIDLKQSGGTLAVKAQARGVDLTKAARLALIEGPAISGVVDADVDVTMRGDDLQGTVRVEAREAGVDLVQGVGATLNAAIKGRDVQAEAKVTWMDGATAGLHTRQARLAGPSLRPASWQKATFDAGLTVDADLARTMALLPEPAQPLRQAAGRVKLTVDAVRSDLKRLPDVRVATHTESVDVTLPPGSDQYGNIVGVPQRINGADVEASLGLDGATEKLSTTLALSDTHGPLVSAEASLQAPLRRIAARPWEAVKLLETSPVEARVSVPERKIQDLPLPVRPSGLAGSIAFSVEAHGTAQKPDVTVSADATHITTPGQELVKEPIDVKVRAGYQGERAIADVTIAERKVDVASVHGEVAVTVADLLAPPAGGPRWEASARADFMGLPVQSLAALAGSSIVGCLYGTVRLDGLHRDARVAADLHMEKMQIGEVPLHEARLAASFDGHKATAEIFLREDGGHFDVSGTTGLRWGAALTPTLAAEDGTEPMDARLQAKAFRLKPLEPFLQSVVAKLDGQLDADIRVNPSAQIKNSRADGWLTIKGGVAEPIALGQELRDIEARVTITPTGQVTFENITFRGLSGRATLTGRAQLEQLRLATIQADLVIRERERFVLTTQGVALGDIYGHVRLEGGQASAGTPLKLQVNIDEFEIDLPNTGTRSLQPLDPDPTIRVGYRTPDDDKFHRIETTEERKEREERRKDRVEQARRDAADAGATPTAVAGAATSAARAGNEMAVQTEPPPKLTPDQRQEQRRRRRPVSQKPLDEMALILDVNLSNKTKVRRGSQISIDLHGHLRVGLGDRVAVEGQAQVDRGYVDIQGRRFYVERAIATFDQNEDVANPTISATARYEAGDATRVYADFLGTVEAGKLTLRSDPALSQGEILSLILFGSREGLSNQRNGQGAQNRTAQAAGVGGGVVTQGLNEALSGLNLEEVSTRVDTSQSGNPRPELSVAITRDVTASISYRLGIPTPGQNPDTTMLRLDYRFKPRWSLETSLGDRGTSILDLFWRYRY